MSKMYRLMLYFGVATLLMYSKEIDHEYTTVNEFKEKNHAVLQRVFDEGVLIFDYEISAYQMTIIASAYISAIKNPQKVSDTKPYAHYIKQNRINKH